MKYNFRYEQDCNKIKKILDFKKKKVAIGKLSKAYKISIATIYRHLKQPIPSLRKVRADAGTEKKPVTKREIGIASEIVKSGKTRKAAKSMLKVSQHKMTKISKKIKTADVNTVPLSISMNIRSFLRTHFNLEYISDSSVIPIKFKNRLIELTKSDVNDVVMILCNAGNRTADQNNKLRFDRMEYMRSMLIQKIEEKIKLAKEESNSDELKKLLNMHQTLEKRRSNNMTPNFKIVEKICKELKPDISFDEVYSLVEKHSQ